MIIEFADLSEVLKVLQQAKLIAAIAAVAILATALVFAFRREYLRVVVAVVLSMAGFLMIRSLAAYPFKESYFTRIETTSTEVRLYFPSAQSQGLLLRREQIASVWFGVPDKAGRSCYLRIELKSGDSYRSPTVPGSKCKDQRFQIIRLLRLQASVSNHVIHATREDARVMQT